ncbi:bile acid:sodium symporter family protein [Marinospirillum sp.]|uniref:bile acid:sodium symporter family protein n=1 Tax=Marinospirillum sp. TaxID=2183934 RepID=UPI0028701B1E|nr:bile acid:sodium symporter family protein [Marinospirillum sp.]MDR9467571.1 bile acid:sodium symporter family protein [Marinospirillum sp.]
MQQLVTQVLLPLILALVMLGIGMALQPADFKRVLLKPKACILGLFLQLLFLPCLALVLIGLLPLSPLAAAGLFLVSLCPGGATSNLFSLIARGDAALSVTLTGVTSLLTPLTLPLLFLAYLQINPLDTGHFQLPLWPAIQQLALVTLVPVVLGMLIRLRFPTWAIRFQPGLRRLSTLAMLLIVISLLATHLHLLERILSVEGLAILLLSTTAILSGYLMARKLGLKEREQRTLGLEVGVQNAGTAIMVALTILQMPALVLVPLMYGILMNLPAFGFVAWLYRKDQLETTDLDGEVNEGV